MAACATAPTAAPGHLQGGKRSQPAFITQLQQSSSICSNSWTPSGRRTPLSQAQPRLQTSTATAAQATVTPAEIVCHGRGVRHLRPAMGLRRAVPRLVVRVAAVRSRWISVSSVAAPWHPYLKVFRASMVLKLRRVGCADEQRPSNQGKALEPWQKLTSLTERYAPAPLSHPLPKVQPACAPCHPTNTSTLQLGRTRFQCRPAHKSYIDPLEWDITDMCWKTQRRALGRL